jgi:hypothetical protein
MVARMRNVLATVLVAVVATAGCEKEAMVREERRATFQAGTKVAEITEIARRRHAGGHQVERRHVLASAPSDPILLSAYVDDDGLLEHASYRREGARGRRYVEVIGAAGGRGLLSKGDGERMNLPNLPIVATDLAHMLRPRRRAIDVVLVDLANAELALGRVLKDGTAVDEDGKPLKLIVDERRIATREQDEEPLDVAPVSSSANARAFEIPLELDGEAPPESWNLQLEGEVFPKRVWRLSSKKWDAPEEGSEDRLPTPFLESGSPRVVSFARTHATPGQPAAEVARALAGAVHPRVDDVRAGGPPSAVWTERFGAGPSGGAALVVASLRALGFAARPVVGYRWVAGQLVPLTFAEVKGEEGWLIVDVTVPFVGTSSAYVPLARSLGGAFSTGRAYGRVTAARVDEATVAAVEEEARQRAVAKAEAELKRR